MTREKKSVGKRKEIEHLNLKIDPMFAFALAFAARVKGQTKTTFVERAVRKAIEEVKLSNDQDWRWFWHPNEGVRKVRMAIHEPFSIYHDLDDSELRVFIDEHFPFFFDIDSDSDDLSDSKTMVLWANIEEYLRVWDETKDTDFWAVGRVMNSALKNAGLPAPEWPPKGAPRPTKAKKK